MLWDQFRQELSPQGLHIGDLTVDRQARPYNLMIISRFILPIERFVLPKSVTSAPIPSLTNRQFVVTGLASDVEKAQRELFWYREELLKRVQANWKEVWFR